MRRSENRKEENRDKQATGPTISRETPTTTNPKSGKTSPQNSGREKQQKMRDQREETPKPTYKEPESKRTITYRSSSNTKRPENIHGDREKEKEKRKPTERGEPSRTASSKSSEKREAQNRERETEKEKGKSTDRREETRKSSSNKEKAGNISQNIEPEKDKTNKNRENQVRKNGETEGATKEERRHYEERYGARPREDPPYVIPRRPKNPTDETNHQSGENKSSAKPHWRESAYPDIMIVEEEIDNRQFQDNGELNYEWGDSETDHRNEEKENVEKRGLKRASEAEKVTGEMQKRPKEDTPQPNIKCECTKKQPHLWCKVCTERQERLFKRTKDFNFQPPYMEYSYRDMALQWTMKKGLRKEPNREQLSHETVQRYTGGKRHTRYIEEDNKIMNRSEGIEIDEAWYDFMNPRDQDGWSFMQHYHYKLNPIFTKHINNIYRCACDKEVCVGTVRQHVHHSIAEHSHINNREILCLECHHQGINSRFMTAESLWRHISNNHERLLLVGHNKCDLNGHRSNNGADRWLAAYSQMLIAATLEKLNEEGFLNDSFWNRERKGKQ